MDVRNLKKNNKGQGTVVGEQYIAGSETSKEHVTDAGSPSITSFSSDLEAENPDMPTLIADYREYLSENGITDQEIFTTLDTIITTGNVYWEFQVLKKINVVFKMRPAWVNSILMKKIDEEQPQFYSRFSDIVGVYNLAGSLHQFDKEQFAMESEDDFEVALRFVTNLPYMIQNLLVKQMAIFDRLIAVASSDWAVENFTELPLERSEQG